MWLLCFGNIITLFVVWNLSVHVLFNLRMCCIVWYKPISPLRCFPKCALVVWRVCLETRCSQMLWLFYTAKPQRNISGWKSAPVSHSWLTCIEFCKYCTGLKYCYKPPLRWWLFCACLICFIPCPQEHTQNSCLHSTPVNLNGNHEMQILAR